MVLAMLLSPCLLSPGKSFLFRKAGSDQEEAAKTLGANDWQIFWRVTYLILVASLWRHFDQRARVGEFGAVSVVSGNIARKTQTLPFVEEAYKQYQKLRQLSQRQFCSLVWH